MWLEHHLPLLTYHPQWPEDSRDISRTRLTNGHRKTAQLGPVSIPPSFRGLLVSRHYLCPQFHQQMKCGVCDQLSHSFASSRLSRQDWGTVMNACAEFQGTPAPIIFSFLRLGQVQGLGPLLPSLRQGSALGALETHR